MGRYKLAIIGYPLTHSLSGTMQNAALRAAGLEGEYETLETPPEDLINVIKKLKTQGYQGFNVTIPHKVPITLFLSSFDEAANVAGAVNTVKILEDKSLEGYNTDIYGFCHPLKEKNISLKSARAAVLGTGGAARAVCAGLSELGVSEIDLYSRNIIDSHKTVQLLREKFSDKVKINLLQVQILKSLENYKILINTTPVGMKNFAQGVSPLPDEVLATLGDDAVVYDLVYNPIKTELISQAEKLGKTYIGGLDMLVHQGAKAFKIWTGAEPDVQGMKIAALEKLM
ncbi:shikimate 5-dehydrogenase [Candidatus Gastranaerophilus sp. (ex Termes propinquus)]|nr:shikimate 5-dehydrogenase [Candidatus Gastranaerophilus sp. (ex Termes propinquus)]